MNAFALDEEIHPELWSSETGGQRNCLTRWFSLRIVQSSGWNYRHSKVDFWEKLRILYLCFHLMSVSKSFSLFIFSFTGLHGYNFSKEDHVELVQLLLEVILLPDLDLGTVSKLASAICRLLRWIIHWIAFTSFLNCVSVCESCLPVQVGSFEGWSRLSMWTVQCWNNRNNRVHRWDTANSIECSKYDYHTFL